MSDVLTDAVLANLEKRVSAATHGEWQQSGSNVMAHGWDVAICYDGRGRPEETAIANAAFIAAANPVVMGALIAEVKALRSVPPGALLIKGPATDESRRALIESLKQLRASPDWGRVLRAPELNETEGLSIAAEFFEAMDASGDREPLTPSAVARLLREYAQERFRKASAEHSARVQVEMERKP